MVLVMSIIKDIFTVNRKTFFNPSKWLDYASVAGYTQMLFSALKSMFSKPVPTREESFEQAMQRLNLSEQDVATGIKKYRLFAIVFLGFGLIALFYGFFLLFRYGTFAGWTLSMAMFALFFSRAYQYDFWSYQMRKRKLGLTVQDYLDDTFGNKGAS